MNRESDIRQTVVKKLRNVIDPELGVNIVDLGLLYQILVEDDSLRVEFTTTTPGCPMRRYLQQQVEKAIAELEDIHKSEVEMVMKPDWNVEMIKEGVEFFSVPPPPRH
jgi:metal-sulfur cluster biosynthetic enzyme